MICETVTLFSAGVSDATADVSGGWCPSVDHLTLDFIVNELRGRLNCSDSYLAGYLSVIYSE